MVKKILDIKKYMKIYNKEYYLEHKKERQAYHRLYYLKNKPRLQSYKKQHYQENKEYYKRKRKEYYQENKEKVKKYLEKNKKKMNDYYNKYHKKRCKEDKGFKILKLLRSRLISALKKYTKTGKIKSSKEYGIDYQAIINYIQPIPENLQDYHLHHIKPLFSFNFINPDGSTNIQEIQKAFAPENHQLLLINEHRKINYHDWK